MRTLQSCPSCPGTQLGAPLCYSPAQRSDPTPAHRMQEAGQRRLRERFVPLQVPGRSSRQAQHLLAPVTEQVWRLAKRPCCRSAQR